MIRIALTSILVAGSLVASQSVATTTTEVLSPVGAINCQAGLTYWFSTGSLVEDRRTVLAAGHFDTFRRGWIDHEKTSKNCRFTLYAAAGRPAFSSRFDLLAKGGTAETRRISNATDWALLHLQTDAPVTVTPLKLSLESTPFHRRNVILVGSAKLGRGTASPTLSCNAWPRRSGSVAVQHACPTKSGWSGAPVLGKVDGQLRAVGVHSGREGEFGVAVGFTGKLAERLQEMFEAKLSQDSSGSGLRPHQ